MDECPEETNTEQHGWIVGRPSFDDASKYSLEFCQELIDIMKNDGTQYLDCSKDDASRQAVVALLEAVTAEKADFLFYNHGSEEGLVAQGGKDYIIDKENDYLLIGRIVYTLACSWGADGGWQAKRNGAKAVHCYVEVVGFMTSALPDFQESFNYGWKLLHERMKHGLEPNFSGLLEKEKAKFTELSDKLMSEGNFLGAMWMNRNCDSVRWYNGGGAPPESKCFWRRLAVKIFGSKLGWNLLRTALALVGLWIPFDW